jgi:hypothetical protein
MTIKRFLTCIIILFSILGLLLNPVLGQSNFGVKQGEKYEWRIIASGTAVPEAGISKIINATYQVTIKSIYEDHFDYHHVMTYDDGSKQSYDDSYYPLANPGNYPPYFVKPDLQLNNIITTYPGVPVSANVSLLVNRTYSFGSREVAYVDFGQLEGAYITKINGYFDQQTGVLIEFSSATFSKDNANQPIATLSRVLTTPPSSWTVPEFPSLLAIALLFGAILVCAIILKKNTVLKAKSMGTVNRY